MTTTIDPLLRANSVDAIPGPESELSLESAIKEANLSMIRDIQKEIEEKFSLLSDLQSKMKRLRDLLARCHKCTNEEGLLDATKLSSCEKEEAMAILDEFKIEQKEFLTKKLSNAERERLIDTIKMKIEDIDLPNKTHFLKVQTLLNMRNEAYLSARSNQKVIHETKTRNARESGK